MILVHQNDEILWRRLTQVLMNGIFLLQEKLHILPLFQQIKMRCTSTNLSPKSATIYLGFERCSQPGPNSFSWELGMQRNDGWKVVRLQRSRTQGITAVIHSYDSFASRSFQPEQPFLRDDLEHMPEEALYFLQDVVGEKDNFGKLCAGI